MTGMAYAIDYRERANFSLRLLYPSLSPWLIAGVYCRSQAARRCFIQNLDGRHGFEIDRGAAGISMVNTIDLSKSVYPLAGY